MKRVSNETLRHIYERACIGDRDGVRDELLDGEAPDGSGDLIVMSILSELIDARAYIAAHLAWLRAPESDDRYTTVTTAYRRYRERWGTNDGGEK
jgi:hypothetical protein